MNITYSYINEIENLLKSFQSLLSKPQFVHFEQIIKGILFSERKSINSYSKSATKNQSSLCRFMTSKALNDKELNQVLFDLIISNLNLENEIDFIFDDTIKHHKYGKQISGIGIHYDHLEKTYSLGHNIVTAGINQNGFFYPTNCELYQNQANVSEISAFKTKIEIALDYLKQWLDKVDNVLMDSWYSAKEILNLIIKKGKTFFTMLKCDRNFKSNHKTKRQLQEWNKYIDPRKYKIYKIKDQYYAIYEMIGFLPEVGKVKILFSKFYDPITKKSKDLHYLCTNNLNLKVEEILLKYLDRWPIETFHRDIKQNLGFEKSIIRNLIGIKRHLIMSFIAHNFLVFIKKNEISCGQTQKELKYSFIENVLQNYGIKGYNLEACKRELMILC